MRTRRPGAPSTSNSPRGEARSAEPGDPRPVVNLAGSPSPMPGRCGAKLPGSNPARYCKRYPIHGRTRCYRCGGKSRRGIDHPNFKHGEYSRYVPRGFGDAYARIVADTEIAALRHELAVMDLRLDELLRHLDEPIGHGVPPSTLMARLAELWKYYEATSSGAARAEIAELLVGGQKVAALWAEARELIDLRRKTAESESRRTERKAGMMTREEAAALVAAVVAAIRKHEDDERKLSLIAREIELLTVGSEPLTGGGVN